MTLTVEMIAVVVGILSGSLGAALSLLAVHTKAVARQTAVESGLADLGRQVSEAICRIDDSVTDLREWSKGNTNRVGQLESRASALETRQDNHGAALNRIERKLDLLLEARK